MKVTSYQRHKVAEKVAKFYADVVGVCGYFVTPREREKLTEFAERMLKLKGKTYTADYIYLSYTRTLKDPSDVALTFCASLIVHDVLGIDKFFFMTQ